jgi:amino acid adenylation domain-containing protein
MALETLLHHYLERSARVYPKACALIDRARAYSYSELDTLSNQLARLLLEQGASRGDRIGLYLDKSAESVVALYGVLKAGCVYVPLDPQAPLSRVAYIARDCGIRYFLTGVEKRRMWEPLAELGVTQPTFIVMNSDDIGESPSSSGITVLPGSAIVAMPTDGLNMPSISQDLAYILYTSGSTGEPKGVMLSHRNALAFVHWAIDEFGITDNDRLSSHAPLHFDLSVFDIFASVVATATLVLVPSKAAVFPAEVSKFIAVNEITIWYSVPSVLSRMVEQGSIVHGAFPQLRTILFAGEVFPTKFLHGIMTLLPHVRFCNLFGPTETNVCTWYDVAVLPDDRSEPIPIGKAISDVETYVVAEDGNQAGIGQAGELYVRGPTVMQGYWGDPTRTTRSLVPSPFDRQLNDPVYKTGDLVRTDDDGNYRFLGRRDAQIKSRGYRIELGEIETALYTNPAVIDCAALAIPDEIVTNRLIACVVVHGRLEEAELMRTCAERLPKYMVPETIQVWEVLPKTSTGKVDRQLLYQTIVSGSDTPGPSTDG